MKLKTKDSSILITGASSGMGNEIARQVAVDARQIIPVARLQKTHQYRSVFQASCLPPFGLYFVHSKSFLTI